MTHLLGRCGQFGAWYAPLVTLAESQQVIFGGENSDSFFDIPYYSRRVKGGL